MTAATAARSNAWKARSDRGPHIATLPSGEQVEFVVPDSNALIRSGRLPSRLLDIAVMAAAYPDGAEGYVADLAYRAVTERDTEAKAAAAETLAQAIRDGLELRDWLVAQMVVKPELTPDDVIELPEPDVEMLLEFAERKRNTDSLGVVLPIVVLEEFARFRGVEAGGEGDAAGEGDGAVVPVVDAGSGGGAV